MKIVGLFAGIGRIGLGMEKAGHETLLLCEKDPQARRCNQGRRVWIQSRSSSSVIREILSSASR